MSPFWTALIASGAILTIILATDLGTRRLTTWRILRSVLAVVVVVAFFVRSLPLDGNDPLLQLAGIGLGLICGLIGGTLLPAHREESGHIFTVGGVGYALLWTLLSAARVVFAYGSEHWFGPDIVRFSINYQLSGQDVYANTFVFMAVAMVLARTGVLMAKRRRLVREAG
ncbi:hypothetical protein ABT294_46915 [Nonomuraea sp. NPDC000554]|uniref:hypothetical protein n=1 Tax=Nonomuraea sp. NPDC000554 TaxID=3154259 RepID=UPI0033246F4B